ncbi:MAG: peptidase [bacterium]|nr:MAG: peptidase [bacterium]
MRKTNLPSLKKLKTKVGHATKRSSKTGCTVLLFDPPALCGVHTAGGAPGTRETDLLDPTCMMDEIHGLLLSGGSAFGLSAADGVMRFLAERGVGYRIGGDRIPVVPAAVIYDRGVGKRDAPTPKDGYRACKNCAYDSIAQGRVGAGCGATVGKFSDKLMPDRGGLSVLCEKFSNRISVAVVMVVNALGNVIDPASGKPVACARDKKGNVKPFNSISGKIAQGANTTIGAIVTDAALSKQQAKRIAMMAHDGLAKSINPSHTLYDGDTIFVASTGGNKADVNALGIFCAEITARAVIKAVTV